MKKEKKKGGKEERGKRKSIFIKKKTKKRIRFPPLFFEGSPAMYEYSNSRSTVGF